MDQNIKKQWVEALRSGKYKQGRCWLRHEDNFCCLGVLCDLHAQATKREWDIRNNIESYLGSDIGIYLDCDEILPDEVVKWAGLCYNDPFIHEDKKISWYNDEERFDFDQIADLIEASHL